MLNSNKTLVLFFILLFIILLVTNKCNCNLANSIIVDCPLELSTCKCEEYQQRKIRIVCNQVNDKYEPLMYIPRINHTLFKHVHLITHLDLSSTLIQEVPTDAFHGMSGLVTLIIKNCDKLTKISLFAFRALKSLKQLVISNNAHLHHIEAHAFGNLKNLQLLSLKSNKLEEIDGYVFSSSTSISTIELIGNPISKIKSHAFHGLRNVTNLVISTLESKTPIRSIEADSFISTAFVENIYLQGIPCRVLMRNSFRGLSNTRLVDFSHSHIEEIQANAFYHAINIQTLNLSHCKIKTTMFNSHAFKGMHAINEIDLRGNYISSLNEAMFSQIIADFSNQTHKSIDKKIYFDRNPIKCDCNLSWLLTNSYYLKYVSLPEVCAGPPGYDCLRISELTSHNLPCSHSQLSAEQTPCKSVFIKYKNPLTGSTKKIDFISNKNNFNSSKETTTVNFETTKANYKIDLDVSDWQVSNKSSHLASYFSFCSFFLILHMYVSPCVVFIL